MREIIYRCWDSRNKEFAYSNERNDYAKFVFENDTIVCYFGEDYGDDFRWGKAENTLEEYIGMKDKNGDKVFEGDIMRIPNDLGCYEVYYEIEEAKFKLKLHCLLFEEQADLKDGERVIIGNIHDED